MIQGGFAKCYLATCMQTKREYALKIVAKSSLLKPKSRQKVSFLSMLRLFVLLHLN